LLLCLLTAGLAPRPGHAEGIVQNQGPRAFLQGIYALYIGDNAPGMGINADPEPGPIKQYFSPELAQIMISAYQKNTSDYVEDWEDDFFVENPDWVIASVKIEVNDKPSGERVKAKVSFVNEGGPNTILFDLVRIAGIWRIDNIDWGDKTIRQIFTRPGMQ
jgi:hypothetical protein